MRVASIATKKQSPGEHAAMTGSALTREANTPLLVSNDVIEAVRYEAADGADGMLGSVKPDRDRSVRGRAAPVSVWMLDEDARARMTAN